MLSWLQLASTHHSSPWAPDLVFQLLQQRHGVGAHLRGERQICSTQDFYISVIQNSNNDNKSYYCIFCIITAAKRRNGNSNKDHTSTRTLRNSKNNPPIKAEEMALAALGFGIPMFATATALDLPTASVFADRACIAGVFAWERHDNTQQCKRPKEKHTESHSHMNTCVYATCVLNDHECGWCVCVCV